MIIEIERQALISEPQCGEIAFILSSIRHLPKGHQVAFVSGKNKANRQHYRVIDSKGPVLEFFGCATLVESGVALNVDGHVTVLRNIA